MITQPIDLRYPFRSAAEFILGGYWTHAEAMHLVFGQIALLGLFLYFLTIFRGAFGYMSACLAISWGFVTNDSFKIMGFTPPEWATAIAAVSCVREFARGRLRLSANNIFLLALTALILIHSLFVFCLYGLGNSDLFFTRIILAARPAMVVLALILFFKHFTDSQRNQDLFFITASTSLFLSAVVFLFQFAQFKWGVSPYGTYPSAGFAGVRFGGLSMEGGHLAKLSFPVLLAVALLSTTSQRLICTLFCFLVFTLNVSASGYAYLAFFIATLAASTAIGRLLEIRNRITVPRFAFLISSLLATIWVGTHLESVQGLLEKITHATAVMWDYDKDVYGRSPIIVTKVLEQFPLGVGYAGSTQRNIAAGLIGVPYSESNLGINVYLEAVSFFGLLPLMLFMSMTLNELRLNSISSSGVKNLRKAVILTIPFIMIVDVLFVLPQLWGAYIIARNKPSSS